MHKNWMKYYAENRKHNNIEMNCLRKCDLDWNNEIVCITINIFETYCHYSRRGLVRIGTLAVIMRAVVFVEQRLLGTTICHCYFVELFHCCFSSENKCLLLILVVRVARFVYSADSTLLCTPPVYSYKKVLNDCSV